MAHCSISKEDLQEIASHIVCKLKYLKNINVTNCKVKDDGFDDFSETLCYALSVLKVSFHLKQWIFHTTISHHPVLVQSSK